MNKHTYNDRVARLNEVSKIIENLPVEIRALSFTLLKEYIIGDAAESPITSEFSIGRKPTNSANYDIHASRDEFLASHNHEKPSDNVYLLIAALYRDYGIEPFSVKELQSLATNTGVTIPGRVDMTLKQATANGKNLFTSTSRGYYKPTVYGEAFLKDAYKISKGTKNKVAAE